MNKTINPLLKDCFVLEPLVFEDDRGTFYESFNKETFYKTTGISFNPVQDNEVFSKYGVIRGFHFQKPPFEQAKLIRVIKGEIYDFAIDIRPSSNTFGKVLKVCLSAKNRKQFFIPKGFAHGYSVVSKEAVVLYKTDNHYAKNHESGIHHNDSSLAIDWGIPQNERIISEKDKTLPLLADLKL